MGGFLARLSFDSVSRLLLKLDLKFFMNLWFVALFFKISFRISFFLISPQLFLINLLIMLNS
jgi:hypothetical protein